MAHLTLVGLSADRTRLLLVDGTGAEFTLDVDNALRSAVRGEQPRPGHLETRMDSALRPRDIQARIRAGATAEQVAEAAGSTVEKIMPYAGPVLAERAHVAERAQKSSLRRRASEGSGSLGGGRTLAEAVSWQLRSHNVDPDTVEWDAHRRDDGRWTVTGLFETAERAGVATYTFDVPGNYSTLEDDDARWLVGDLTHEPEPAPVVPETGRRLSAVPTPLGEDAIDLVKSADPSPAVSPDTEPTVDLTETLARGGAAADEPTLPFGDPVATEPAAAAEPAETVVDEPEEPAKPKRPSKKRGRASVPSWDEIMFGGGTGE